MTQMQTTAALPALTREELEAHWMPFTPNREFKQNPRMIVRAEGCHYVTDDGRRVFDSLSGLWCCGLGHGRTEISRAVAQQIRSSITPRPSSSGTRCRSASRTCSRR